MVGVMRDLGDQGEAADDEIREWMEGPLGDQGEAADDEIREWMEEYLEKFHRVVESHLEAVAEQTEVWN